MGAQFTFCSGPHLDREGIMKKLCCGVFLSLCCLLSPGYGQSRSKVVPNRSPLRQNAFNPFPLRAIEPRGWLREQLEIQAEGLTGHLGEFWKDVGNNSGWLGGTGESWERGPYYLDGLLPLAYQLDLVVGQGPTARSIKLPICPKNGLATSETSRAIV